MDIRAAFLDSSALQNAKSQPVRLPSPPPETVQAPSVADPEHVRSQSPEEGYSAPSRRPSKILQQMTSAMSAAKSATMIGSFKGSSAAPSDEAARNDRTQGEQGTALAGMASSIASRISATNLSVRAFKRGSRTEENNDTASDQLKLPKASPQRADGWTQPEGQTADTKSTADSGGQEDRTSTFGGGALGEQSTYNATTTSAPPQVMSAGNLDQSSSSVGGTRAASSPPASSAASPSVTAGMRKGRRAFAGGLWNANSGQGQAEKSTSTGSHHSQAPTGASTVRVEQTASEPSPQPTSVPGGGKRSFAGGGIGGGLGSGSSGAGQADNPFGGGNGGTSGGGNGLPDRPARDAAAAVETSSHPRKAEEVQSTPSWATVGNDSEAAPDWARGADAGSAAYGGYGSGDSAGVGLAPPSR